MPSVQSVVDQDIYDTDVLQSGGIAGIDFDLLGETATLRGKRERHGSGNGRRCSRNLPSAHWYPTGIVLELITGGLVHDLVPAERGRKRKGQIHSERLRSRGLVSKDHGCPSEIDGTLRIG